MSATAEITLTGNSHKVLLDQIEQIKAWDNGHNYPIHVYLNGSDAFVPDSIENVENAIKNDLVGYLEGKFNLKQKGLTLKSAGNDDLWLCQDPDKTTPEGKKKKARNKMLHLKPAKKKRKKTKKTHRK